MNSFRMRKGVGTLVSLDEGQRLFAGTSYKVSLSAPEYRTDTGSASDVALYAGGVRIAGCGLVPDPQRRGLRTSADGSHLEIPAYREDVPVSVRVGLGGDVLVYMGACITGVADGDAAPSARWTVTDLGRVESGDVALADMSQVKLTAPLLSVPLAVIVSSGSLDAYIVVVGETVGRFPFTDVLVNGSAPVWSHQDSYLMPAQRWVLHLVKVAGDFYADLRAGRPGGTEVDPDGAAVVSAEVNA